MRIELVAELSGQRVIGLSGMKALADNGDATALNFLGEWLLMGFECSPDANYAKKCFEKAARQGNTKAMLNLGHCYIGGHGTKKNFAAAERWIRAADELGDSEAVEVCEELYLTTIGSHKPDLYSFVDFCLTKIKRERGISGKIEYEDDAKRELIAEYVLKGAGKSEEEIENLKDKVTEADIRAYESMNDLYDGEDDFEETELDNETYCRLVFSNMERLDREGLARFIKLLYHLASKGSHALKQEILALGAECFKEYDYVSPLTWWERASLDVNEKVLGSLEAQSITQYLEEIGKNLLSVEKNELETQYTKSEQNSSALRKMRKIIQIEEKYDKALEKEWCDKITNRIISLENKELEDLFELAKDDYNKLVELYNDVNSGTYEKATQKEWGIAISDTITAVQERELALFCEGIDSKDHDSLVQLFDQAQKRYTFNADVLEKYLLKISQLIDRYEIEKLEKICANSDDLNSEEYSRIIRDIKGLGFKDSNTQKYVELITDKSNNAKIMESCTDNMLENYDLDQLNDRIRAVHFSTIAADVKKQLSARITHYIDLIYDCKDKATLELQKNTSPENIGKQSCAQLQRIKEAVEMHQRLDQDTKKDIIKRITEQLKIIDFREKNEGAEEKKRYSDKEIKDLTQAYPHKYIDSLMQHPIPNDEVQPYSEPKLQEAPSQGSVETGAQAALTVVETEKIAQPAPVLNVSLAPNRPDSDAIVKQLAELVAQYGNTISHRVLLPGNPLFEKKIGKAISAFAHIMADEKPILLEDFTLFGSAKEGTVWTEKNVYQKDMLDPKKVVSLQEAKEVRCVAAGKTLYYIVLDTPSASLKISMRSNEAEAKKVADFYCKVLSLVKGTDNKTVVIAYAPEWKCVCGNVCKDKFCIKCGRTNSAQSTSWRCSCGKENNGNFCAECGAFRKE